MSFIFMCGRWKGFGLVAGDGTAWLFFGPLAFGLMFAEFEPDGEFLPEE